MQRNDVLFYACNPKRDYWALSTSSPEPALPLSSGKGNRRSVEELKTGTIKSWFRFNCPMREIVYPFDQEKLPGEFCFAGTLVHNRSKAVFIYVTFDLCIKKLERTLKETEKFIYLLKMPPLRHSLVMTKNVLSSSQYDHMQLYANLKSSVTCTV